MNSEQSLIEALGSIERKHAGLPFGQTGQTDEAKARILKRVQQEASAPDVRELRLTLPDHWSRILFHAILKRYGLKAYRYKGQRASTVMVRTSQELFDDTLFPLLREMSEQLNKHFGEVVSQVFPVALSAGPYNVAVLPAHDHGEGQLCAECAKKLGG